MVNIFRADNKVPPVNLMADVNLVPLPGGVYGVGVPDRRVREVVVSLNADRLQRALEVGIIRAEEVVVDDGVGVDFVEVVVVRHSDAHVANVVVVHATESVYPLCLDVADL